MKKPLVCVTRKIPKVGMKILEAKKYQLRVNKKDRPLTRAELATFVKGADVILSLLSDDIDGSVMDSAGPQLKLIANYAVGYDNIHLDAAKKRGICVTNTAGASNESVAEFAVACMFAAAKHLPQAHDFVEFGKYRGWNPALFIGEELLKKTVGIVGLGRIGCEVARISKHGLRMEVLYHDAVRNLAAEKELGLKFVSLETLLKKSDFVSLHVPLLPTTRHMIGKKELSLMKKNAILINTARGPVVDEKALVAALKKKTIAAAALDVYEFEPRLSVGLAKLPNVVLSPHIASATVETRNRMAVLAAENVVAVLSSKAPVCPVPMP
jgi:glyoxylate reductase